MQILKPLAVLTACAVTLAAPQDLARKQQIDALVARRDLGDELVKLLFHMSKADFEKLVKGVFAELVAESDAEAAQLRSAVTCDLCTGGLSVLGDALIFESAVTKVADWACNTFQIIKPASRCNGLVGAFVPWLAQVLRDPAFDDDARQQLCHNLAKLCPTNTVTTANLQFPSPKPKGVTGLKPAKKNVKHIVQLSDFHLDPEYVVGAEGACTGFLCCRPDSNPTSGTIQRPCSPYGDFGADTPQALAISALQQIKSVVPNIDLVLLTGDLVPHNLWETTTANVFSALEQAIGLIKQYLPGTPVIPAVGNHDTSPSNYFAPTFSPSYVSTAAYGPAFTATKNALNHMGDLFASWLPADAIKTFKQDGSYAVRPWAGLKVISFNTNYCYADDLFTYLLGGVTDPDNVLAWVISELADSEAKGEKAYIIGHIPPGLLDCVEDYSHLFYQIVDRYSASTLVGLFYGHVHNDAFQVFYSVGTEKTPSAQNAINAAYVSPSLTPYTKLNPGFRVYTVDADTFQVIDSATYIADLNNATSWKNGPVWVKEYDASAAYGAAYDAAEGWLSPAFWHRVTEQVATNDAALKTYNRLNFKSSGLEGTCDAKCRATTVCGLRAGKSELLC
ncbi:Metallo-dependent phosphatase-like protein [Chytriomyces sp. MP71]|nr:Metallo-dependent phosphatase-like protein [Chytriomyces sp. MP71]